MDHALQRSRPDRQNNTRAGIALKARGPECAWTDMRRTDAAGADGAPPQEPHLQTEDRAGGALGARSNAQDLARTGAVETEGDRQRGLHAARQAKGLDAARKDGLRRPPRTAGEARG